MTLMTKIDRVKHGPPLWEVTLGALMSVAFGAAVAVIYLALTPVNIVKELPADASPKTVYFIEGTVDGVRGRTWSDKKKDFLSGVSVEVNEDELNAWAINEAKAKDKDKDAPKPAAPKPADGEGAAPVAVPDEWFTFGTPNFRIVDGVVHIGMPCTFNIKAFEMSVPIYVHAKGGFVSSRGAFVFQPEEFYFGSCGFHKLGALEPLIFEQFMKGETISEDIGAAWAKLKDVSVKDKTLVLTAGK